MAIRGKNTKLITGTLTVGTIVRLKDENWYCSLEVDDFDGYIIENKNRLLKTNKNRLLKTNKNRLLKTDKKLVFNAEMAKLLGKRLEVVAVKTRDNGYGETTPCYKMKTVDDVDGVSNILSFTFINEMLETV